MYIQGVVMPYNFKIDVEMTADIDAEVAKKIIVAAVERETGKQVTEIKVNIEEGELTGFSIRFDPESSKPVFKPASEFVPMNFGEYRS
jgi:hypothetical protein